MSHQPKVFVIGFGKTATTTIHKFFAGNGYNSVHWDLPDDRFLAGVLVTNVLSGRPILATIDHYDVYSEFSYADGNVFLEANYFFKELHEAYPDAYFLLNTRETEGWISSRAKHFGRNKKGRGSLLERISKAYGVSSDETQQIWRDYHAPFHDRVRRFFESEPNARFLEFDIKADGPERLVDWVAPHYDLDPEIWAARNVTTEMEAIRKEQKKPLARLRRKLMGRTP